MSSIIQPQIGQARSLTEGIRIQREVLKQLLCKPMEMLAISCARSGMQEEKLEVLLDKALPKLSYCRQLFVLDEQFVQITQNITREGPDGRSKGQNRSGRPYTVNIVGHTEFKLSKAYTSQNQHRPSMTAIHVIRNEQGELLGFLAADFDMRELPHTEHCYREPDNWHQLKGDPAIRRGLFLQPRIVSIMDDNIDEALQTMQELMVECGVYHGEIHFSRSRATVWHRDDPYSYHLLTINELTSPDSLLAFPQRPYFERAEVPIEQIDSIFKMFRRLRFADNYIYLRSASLNIVNAMVGLNFSCDGSHYMRFNEFLEKDIDFWFGKNMIKKSNI